MSINVGKTEVMRVTEQDPVTHTTANEAKKVCKFKCKNIGCKIFFKMRTGPSVMLAAANGKTPSN